MKTPDQSNEAAVARILASRCYYSILGVPKTSSPAQIRQTYRQLALSFHPDKNKCEGAVEAFQAIGSAYEVLSDRERRGQYDRKVQEDRRGQEDRCTKEDGWGQEYRHSYEDFEDSYRRGGARSRDCQEDQGCDEEEEEETTGGDYGRKSFYYNRRYGR